MFFNLELRTVTNNVKALQVICKEYFEISIVSIMMKSGIDIVVISTGVGGIFNFEIFHKYKIFYYLNIFYLSVL